MVGRKEKELRERENAVRLDRDLLIASNVPQRKRHYSPQPRLPALIDPPKDEGDKDEARVAELMAQFSAERKLQEELKHESKELRRHLDRMTAKFEEERKELAGKIDDLHESLILANKKH